MVLLLNASNLEVLTNGAVITGFCAIWLLHIILLPFVFVQIKKRSKRARSTLKEEYAYFRHGVIYKSFLIGLNGKIPKTATVFAFVLNISLLILLPLTIWHLIAPHIILSNIIRIIYAYCWILMVVRVSIVANSKFKL